MKNKNNRVMLIGAIGSGKTTLTHALLNQKVKAFKTQSLHYCDWIVDTPGEYTENPMYYKSIMATALEVSHVIFIQDATSNKAIFPPGFATGIPKIPIGVITKIDAPHANPSRAVELLRKVMVKGPMILSSAVNKKGLDEIRAMVQCNSSKEIEKFCIESSSDQIVLIK